MKCFDKHYEMMERSELEQFQIERLQALLVRLRRNLQDHNRALEGVQVESLDDLKSLPILSPSKLAEHAPYGMFALPLREVIRLQSAIGPEGHHLVIGHTRNDLLNWSRLVARQMVAAGITAEDVIQICFSGGAFEKSLGALLGAEMIEASVIPQEPFHIDDQLTMLRNYRATVIITTPTNAIELAELLAEKQIDPKSLQIKTILLSRPASDEERSKIENGLLAQVFCAFGVGEVLDPGICVQCEHGRFHINEDQFIAETVDGELILTTLCREAVPLLRYQTRITAEIEQQECPCGRTGATLKPGKRLDERVLINETPVYEKQIRDAIISTLGKDHPFHIEITGRRVVIRLVITQSFFSDQMRKLTEIKEHLESELLSHLGIEAEIAYVNPSYHQH